MKCAYPYFVNESFRYISPLNACSETFNNSRPFLNKKELEVLKYGTVYVNTKDTSTDSAVIPCAVFIKDEQKLAGAVVAKWECENKSLALKDLTSPITVEQYGKTAYADFNEKEDSVLIKQFDDLNILSVVYSTYTSADPMKLTGETSDAYPIACFNAILAKDAAFGSYDINIINKKDYSSTVSPRYVDNPELIGSVDMSQTSKNLSGRNIRHRTKLCKKAFKKRLVSYSHRKK